LKEKKFKSLKWLSKGKLLLEGRNLPVLSENEALLKVESCGICGSDIKILNHGNKRVKQGQIIGHEISGTIIKINGNLNDFKEGDKISLGADVPCGNCDRCESGFGNDCITNLAIGHEFEGGFSQFMVLNEITLKNGPIKKFTDLSFDLACLAEPLACCLNGFEKTAFKRYESVLIMGCGTIGIMLAFIAHLKKIPKIFMTDINQKRIENLSKFNFITSSINTSKENIEEWININTMNKGVELIFTANNNINAQIQGLKLLNSRSVINFFGGLPQNSKTIELNTNDVHYKESIITGSHGSTPKQHSEALGIISSNQVFFKQIISKSYSIDKFATAFEETSKPENLKIIIKPNE